MKKSIIITIEGTDGSGKATQTKLLMQNLKNSGCKVYTNSFPNYESDSSSAVKMYLEGNISENPDDISAEAASIFYATDRYITYKKDMEDIYESGKYVMLFDRYVGSNIIHQGCKKIKKLPEEEKEEELKSFINWLSNLEYEDLKIPRPDITIYLNVPVEYTEKLREGRNNKITGKEKQDIHESDTQHLKNASIAGNMAASILNWRIVECIKDGNMRSIEDISSEVFEIVKTIL